MKVTAEDIAYDLQGTCYSLSEVLAEYDAEELEFNLAFCDRLDSIVFCCESCNWWFEISEMCSEHDVWKCEDCCHE